jgi:hypothetical protein
MERNSGHLPGSQNAEQKRLDVPVRPPLSPVTNYAATLMLPVVELSVRQYHQSAHCNRCANADQVSLTENGPV